MSKKLKTFFLIVGLVFSLIALIMAIINVASVLKGYAEALKASKNAKEAIIEAVGSLTSEQKKQLKVDFPFEGFFIFLRDLALVIFVAGASFAVFQAKPVALAVSVDGKPVEVAPSEAELEQRRIEATYPNLKLTPLSASMLNRYKKKMTPEEYENGLKKYNELAQSHNQVVTIKSSPQIMVIFRETKYIKKMIISVVGSLGFVFIFTIITLVVVLSLL